MSKTSKCTLGIVVVLNCGPPFLVGLSFVFVALRYSYYLAFGPASMLRPANTLTWVLTGFIVCVEILCGLACMVVVVRCARDSAVEFIERKEREKDLSGAKQC